MGWSRWSDDAHYNKKILAVSPAARWLHFAAIGECRMLAAQGDEKADRGVFTKKKAHAMATTQRVPLEAIDELTETFFDNPLWYAEGANFRIHDYEVYKPPPSSDSRGRVQRHRERLRAEKPHLAVVPAKRGRKVKTPEEKAELEARAQKIGVWWANRHGDYAPEPLCKRIARFDVDIEVLIAHLESVAAEQVAVDNPLRSLVWFVRGEGISRLQKLQSDAHKRSDPVKRGGIAKVADLLEDFGVAG